jgi:uncharacterized protein
MRGVATLREHGVPFHAICVLTRDALGHADEMFEFFRDNGIDQVGFNIEELEAAHGTTSLAGAAAEAEFAAFFDRLLRRVRAEPDALRVREIDTVLAALSDPAFGSHAGNCQTDVGGIVSVAVDGEISTFSPELLGTSHPRFGSFGFGNVRTARLGDILHGARLQRVAGEIAAGVAACRSTCRYFDFCRGGAPANKLAETGSFASTETVFCRLTQKLIVESVLGALDEDLELAMPESGCAWYGASRLPPINRISSAAASSRTDRRMRERSARGFVSADRETEPAADRSRSPRARISASPPA